MTDTETTPLKERIFPTVPKRRGCTTPARPRGEAPGLVRRWGEREESLTWFCGKNGGFGVDKLSRLRVQELE